MLQKSSMRKSYLKKTTGIFVIWTNILNEDIFSRRKPVNETDNYDSWQWTLGELGS